MMEPLSTLMSFIENSGKSMMTQTSNKITQTEKRALAGILNFLVFFSFRANEKQNETNKKYTKQDNNKVKCKDVRNSPS